MSLPPTVSARSDTGDSILCLDAQHRPLDLTSLYQAMHCALDAKASGRQRKLHAHYPARRTSAAAAEASMTTAVSRTSAVMICCASELKPMR